MAKIFYLDIGNLRNHYLHNDHDIACFLVIQ